MKPIYIQEMFNIMVIPYDLRDPCTYEGNHIWNSLSMHIKAAERLGIYKDRISKWHHKGLKQILMVYEIVLFMSSSYLTVCL